MILPKSQRQFEAQLVTADPTTDVALLKVDVRDLPRATLADSKLAQKGMWFSLWSIPLN